MPTPIISTSKTILTKTEKGQECFFDAEFDMDDAELRGDRNFCRLENYLYLCASLVRPEIYNGDSDGIMRM